MIDDAFAARLFDELGPVGLRAVAAAFEADQTRLLAALERAVADDDRAAFSRAAHGLAGAAATVGATALERACRAAMAAQGPARWADLLAAIRAGCSEAARDVAAMLAAFGR